MNASLLSLLSIGAAIVFARVLEMVIALRIYHWLFNKFNKRKGGKKR